MRLPATLNRTVAVVAQPSEKKMARLTPECVLLLLLLHSVQAFQRVIVPCVQNCTQQIPKEGKERQACLNGKCYPAAMAADLQVAYNLFTVVA